MPLQSGRSRLERSIMLLLVFGLAASAVTWLLQGAGSGAALCIEDDIESGLREQTGVTVDVTCPQFGGRFDDTVEGLFSCDVVRPDGTKDRVTLSLPGDGGGWWQFG